ncbi:acyltransferase family protein [Paracoccaceae bacterium GXU_MW_L88]
MYFDTLRSFAMIFGVFFHAHQFAPNVASKMVWQTSWAFRMAAFFFVSGLLFSVVLEKRGLAAILRRRAVAIGVPLIAGFLTIVPVLKWATNAVKAYPERSEGFLDTLIGTYTFQYENVFSHLWFLLALLIYIPLAAVVVEMMQARQLAGRLATYYDRHRLFWGQVGFVASIALLCGVLHFLVQTADLDAQIDNTAVIIVHHLPFFLLGAMSWLCFKNFEKLLIIDWRLILLWVLLLGVHLLTRGDVPYAVTYAFKGALNMIGTLQLLAFFRRFANWDGPISRGVSRSIYTVYLFHYPILALLAYGTVRIGMERGIIYYFASVAIALALSFALHFAVIERVPLLKFLYNGRWGFTGSFLRRRRAESR